MQKLCKGRLHKVTSGIKLLLFLGVLVSISGTHVPCDLKSGDGGGYLKGGDGGGDMIVYLA